MSKRRGKAQIGAYATAILAPETLASGQNAKLDVKITNYSAVTINYDLTGELDPNGPLRFGTGPGSTHTWTPAQRQLQPKTLGFGTKPSANVQEDVSFPAGTTRRQREEQLQVDVHATNGGAQQGKHIGDFPWVITCL